VKNSGEASVHPLFHSAEKNKEGAIITYSKSCACNCQLVHYITRKVAQLYDCLNTQYGTTMSSYTFVVGFLQRLCQQDNVDTEVTSYAKCIRSRLCVWKRGGISKRP